MNVNQALEQVAELLAFPATQQPNVRQRLGAVLRERQNFYNELANSSVAWTMRETQLLASGAGDFKVSGDGLGRVLFVTAIQGGVPIPVGFTDAGDRTAEWQDLSEYYTVNNVASLHNQPVIAFFRREGELFARVPSALAALGTLTITYATGSWAEAQPLTARPVLNEYEHLTTLRAARSLLPSCQWSDDPKSDMTRMQMLNQTLAEQEARVAKNFEIAKRSLHADDVVFIEVY